MITVEPLTTTHVEGFVDICHELHAQTHLAHLPLDYDRIHLMAHNCIGDGNWFARVVVDNGGVVGAMCGYVTPTWFSNARLGVEEGIYVRVGVESRTKHAAQMLKEFVEWCRGLGAADVRTGVISNIDNFAVDLFYRRHGFKRIGTIYALKHPGDE